MKKEIKEEIGFEGLKVKPFHLVLFGLLVIIVILYSNKENTGSDIRIWTFDEEKVAIKAKLSGEDFRGELYSDVSIYINEKLIYQNPGQSMTTDYNRLPKVKHLGSDQYEITLGFSKDGGHSKWLVRASSDELLSEALIGELKE